MPYGGYLSQVDTPFCAIRRFTPIVYLPGEFRTLGSHGRSPVVQSNSARQPFRVPQQPNANSYNAKETPITFICCSTIGRCLCRSAHLHNPYGPVAVAGSHQRLDLLFFLSSPINESQNPGTPVISSVGSLGSPRGSSPRHISKSGTIASHRSEGNRRPGGSLVPACRRSVASGTSPQAVGARV